MGNTDSKLNDQGEGELHLAFARLILHFCATSGCKVIALATIALTKPSSRMTLELH